MNTVAAVVLALASVVAYTVGAVVQHRVTGRLLTSGAWWAAAGLNVTGAGLHVVALAYGPLTLVQPIGALTLVAGVPLGAWTAGRGVSREEWRGVALTLVGFGALLPLTATGVGHSGVLGTAATFAVTGIACVAMVAARWVSRPLGFAAASGVSSAAGSALTLTVLTTAFSWQTVLVGTLTAALAVSGFLLSQSAYTGGLGAPLAVLTITNPVVSSVIGLALLGERLPGGFAGAAVAGVGALVAARGIVLLARPPASVAVAADSSASTSISAPATRSAASA
jgi:hypothetical protein